MDTVNFYEGPLNYSLIPKTDNLSYGAECNFFGLVRDENNNKNVLKLSYDIHKPLAKKEITKIIVQAKNQWDSKSLVHVCHSYGTLQLGEMSVIINVRSKHRKEAFAMCEFIMEELKHKAPIWKKEFYQDGETDWLKGHALCQQHS